LPFLLNISKKKPGNTSAWFFAFMMMWLDKSYLEFARLFI